MDGGNQVARLMLWLGTSPHQEEVKMMLDLHQIGLMSQPVSHSPRAGWIWAADNGCFTAKGWSADRWLAWLDAGHPRSGCLFATVPDVVADHAATLERWRVYAGQVSDLRYPLAFVAQDGADETNVPWDEMDCLFIGGSTAWKQGFESSRLARDARERGKWVHVGRVNSLKRLQFWQPLADSSDGTFLAFGPEKNSIRVQSWVAAMRQGTQERML